MKPLPIIVSFAIGWFAGSLWASPTPAPETFTPRAASQRHEVSPPEPTPTVRASASRRVVCTNVAGPRESEVDALNTRLDWCEARLRAITAPRPTGRRAWPEGLPDAEAPDSWADQMDELVSRCELPGEPVVTDCEEYPCVTLMRPVGDTISGPDLRNLIRSCDTLPPALADANIEAAPVPVICPDGQREEALIVSGFSLEGAAILYELEEDEDLEFSDYIVHAGRRVESALQLWACEEATPAD